MPREKWERERYGRYFVRMKIALGIPLAQLKDGTFENSLKFKDSATGSPAIRIWPNEPVLPRLHRFPWRKKISVLGCAQHDI
jgi:hypothetical protein